MSKLGLTLGSDFSATHAFVSELFALAETREGVAQVGDRLPDLIQAGAEAFVFETDHHAAPGARHLTVRAKPSDGLLRLMAALRARDVDFVAVENALGHLETSIPAMKHPALARPIPADTGGAA